MFVCEICRKEFITLMGLCGHKAFCGKETEKTCPICQRKINCYIYSKHVDSHKKDKQCLNCEKTIRSWEKFCCQSCAGTYNNKLRAEKIPKRNCVFCNIVLSKGEKLYCSYKCQKEYRYKKYIERWLNKEVSGNYGNSDMSVSIYVRRWLREQRGEKCEECGWNKVNQYTGKIPLTAHHIDGDGSNTRPENLKLLCGACHSLTSTFGGSNLGNGRKTRRETYKKEQIEFRLLFPKQIDSKIIKKAICKVCNKEFVVNGTAKGFFCSYKCSGLAKRKVKRPSSETLKEEINQNSWRDLGRKYGVTDTAVKNWAKLYKIW